MIVLSGRFSPLQAQPKWKISALPPSVRLDPSSGKILEDRPDIYEMQPLGNLLVSKCIGEISFIYNHY